MLPRKKPKQRPKVKEWVVNATVTLERQIIVRSSSSGGASSKVSSILNKEFPDAKKKREWDDDDDEYLNIPDINICEVQTMQEWMFENDDSFQSANMCPECESYSENCERCEDCQSEDSDDDEEEADSSTDVFIAGPSFRDAVIRYER